VFQVYRFLRIMTRSEVVAEYLHERQRLVLHVVAFGYEHKQVAQRYLVTND